MFLIFLKFYIGRWNVLPVKLHFEYTAFLTVFLMAYLLCIFSEQTRIIWFISRRLISVSHICCAHTGDLIAAIWFTVENNAFGYTGWLFYNQLPVGYCGWLKKCHSVLLLHKCYKSKQIWRSSILFELWLLFYEWWC